MGKTPPFLMFRREVVCNIYCRVLHWSLGGLDTPLANGKERSGFQHLESCTGIWVGKTPPFLMFRRLVVWNIWSSELEFGWVRHPPC